MFFFFRHPHSNTLNISNITFTNNFDIPDVCIIRTDREGVLVKSCRKGMNCKS